MDDMIQNINALKQEIDSLKQALSKHVKEKESLLQTFTVFKKESKEKENKYVDKEIDLEKKIKELDNILSAEQAFWLPLSNPKTEQLNVTQTPVEIEVAKEHPKVPVNLKTSDVMKIMGMETISMEIAYYFSDLSYLYVFGALFYPINDSEDLGKLKPKADIGIFVGDDSTKKAYQIYNKRTRLIIETLHIDFDELTSMASEQFSSGPGPQLMTPGTIIPAAVAPRLADPTGTPSSTTIDQDAPSAIAHLDNDPFFGVLIPEPNSEESSSKDVIPTNVHSVNQPPEHLRKWTKDHPLNNVNGNPS
ncbi:hypothetical protein Tco_0444545 [Tanacetum coccineum]